MLRRSLSRLAVALSLQSTFAITSWYSSIQDGFGCPQLMQGSGPILPLHTVAFRNQFAAFGFYEPCTTEDLSPEAGSCPDLQQQKSVVAVLETDANDKQRWTCRESSMDVTVRSAAVVAIEGGNQCPDTVCVIGGNDRASVDCTSSNFGSRWRAEYTLPVGISSATALFMRSANAGEVGTLFVFGGKRVGGAHPDGTIFYSTVDPRTCQLDFWQPLMAASPFDNRRSMVATVAYIQRGLYVGGGRDIGSAGEARNEWYQDLYFLPFSTFLNASGAVRPIVNSTGGGGWVTASTEMPSPYVADMRGDPPRMIVEVAVTYTGFEMQAVTRETNVSDVYRQWQSMRDAGSDGPTHLPALLMLLGDNLLFSKSFDADQNPVIAGGEPVPLDNIRYPSPPPWGMSSKRAPILRGPVQLVDNRVQHERAVVLAGVTVAGRPAYATGYVEKECTDVCPSGHFSLGCFQHPWDLTCLQCTRCQIDAQFVEVACSSSYYDGYRDTSCGFCEPCPPNMVVVVPCNATRSTECRVGDDRMNPIGPQRTVDVSVDSDVEAPLVTALYVASGTFTAACLALVVVSFRERMRTLSAPGRKGSAEAAVTAKLAFRAAARWILLVLGMCQWWSLVVAQVAVFRTLSGLSWGTGLVCVQIVSLSLSCAFAKAHVGHEHVLPLTVCPPWMMSGLHGMLMAPRALLLLGYSSKQTARVIPVALAVAVRATWAAAASTFVTDFLPSAILMQFVYSRQLSQLRAPFIWLSFLYLMLGLCTVLVASHRLGRYKLLAGIARPKEQGVEGQAGIQEGSSIMNECTGTKTVVVSPIVAVDGVLLHKASGSESMAEQRPVGRQVRVQHILQQERPAEPTLVAPLPVPLGASPPSAASSKPESVYGGYAPGALVGDEGSGGPFSGSSQTEEEESDDTLQQGTDDPPTGQGEHLVELMQAVMGVPLPPGPMSQERMADMLAVAGQRLMAAAQQLAQMPEDNCTVPLSSASPGHA